MAMLRSGLNLGGRYRLDSRIGAGGMGEVWRAVDEVLGRVVAVKAMLPDVAGEADLARRFLTEAKAMASVNHPAVAAIHDYGHSDDIAFLVMEFIDGESLSEMLRRSGRLSPADTMRLVAQAADGLQAVHDCGIVHRDIKPANLMIRRNGSLLITDFGISRTGDGTRLTVSGAILGTPTYLSPEQVLGQPATPLSDIYSLGLTAYECLAGHRPFAGDNPYAVALQRVQSPPRPLDGGLPRPVSAVIERALLTDPAHRWPSAAEFADAARAAADTHPAAPARPAAPPAASAPPRSVRSPRGRWSIAAALLAVALLGGITAWQASRDTDRSAGSAAGAGAGQPSTAPTDAAARAAGFTSCGTALCPTSPLCWGGLTSISGKAMPPGRVDCAKSHRWETFAATYLPADAVEGPQDDLMARADIAAACSASVLASRGGTTNTTGWVRDAWPVQFTGTDIWIVHCLAQPETGEASGSAFSTR
ncbi:serine/threonine-protein kinase [Micromonospora sp. BQ11]|uniref:serine/threonine-protein kinase n=1 Tax=Micromonospora sp. BQ11 TaxID=3452212 RepID=UPI003F8B89C9